jgi:hypothetical protein
VASQRADEGGPAGEVVPWWVPRLGARPIQPLAAVVLAAIGAVLITAISAYGLVNLPFHIVERGPVSAAFGRPGPWVDRDGQASRR